ncbi:hypothetical protein CKY13_06615 [Enterococcus hirae]|nr:hypothetical protein CKY13_06615 [Enterococcus hirae]
MAVIRKDTLNSFRMNWANQFIEGFKMSYTQLIEDTLTIILSFDNEPKNRLAGFCFFIVFRPITFPFPLTA